MFKPSRLSRILLLQKPRIITKTELSRKKMILMKSNNSMFSFYHKILPINLLSFFWKKFPLNK